jgi:hypothetical protein
MKYIMHPPMKARSLKWAAGQRIYGPVFQGDPVEHLYEEFLDALNYCEEIMRRGGWRVIPAAAIWLACLAAACATRVLR